MTLKLAILASQKPYPLDRSFKSGDKDFRYEIESFKRVQRL